MHWIGSAAKFGRSEFTAYRELSDVTAYTRYLEDDLGQLVKKREGGGPTSSGQPFVGQQKTLSRPSTFRNAFSKADIATCSLSVGKVASNSKITALVE